MWPHNCGTYGVARAAQMRDSTALSLRSMVRMGPLGPDRNAGPPALLCYYRILRPRRSPATCATCGKHSVQALIVHDYLKEAAPVVDPRGGAAASSLPATGAAYTRVVERLLPLPAYGALVQFAPALDAGDPRRESHDLVQVEAV